MKTLSRLLNPNSIAVIGGGAWSEAVLTQTKKFGFTGSLYSIHPSKPEVAGVKTYLSVNHLPEVPDAAFVGINREASIGAIERLRKLDAGGAVCFASGFAEATAEDSTGANAQVRLGRAAGEMPVLGPNCYGFINAFDKVAIWPDQHGCVPVTEGVAIITQSSNIAVNLTMQKRGLPIGYVITCGNQAMINQAEIAATLLDDPRVTAIGLHIEGFGELRAWEALSRKARTRNIPLIAIKVGRSEHAQAGAMSHTASMAGGDEGASALLDRLCIRRAHDLPSFLETLKFLHVAGAMPSSKIASISCSGGEASLIADQAHGSDLTFPKLTDTQQKDLREVLGPKVALANPLDYHTYIWRDEDAMTQAWSSMAKGEQDLTLIIVDYPRGDMCDPGDWRCATNAALRTRAATGKRIALVATLPELLPEDISRELMSGGVIPMHGLTEALQVAQLAKPIDVGEAGDLLLPEPPTNPVLLPEHEAKSRLKTAGLSVPRNATAERDTDVVEACAALSLPVAVKAVGLAHKTEHGGVVLGCGTVNEAASAASQMPHDGPFLIEEMIPQGIELLLGITLDPAHGYLLTIAAGGTMTEIVNDKVNLLLPATRSDIEMALTRLKMAQLFEGFRGAAAPDVKAILDAVMAIQNYVSAHHGQLSELEINPLICTPNGAFVADALIRQDI